MDPKSETIQLLSQSTLFTLFPSLNTSQCGGTVVGYEFCSQYKKNTGSNRGTIFTLLVLEDVGSSYTVLHETTFVEQRPINCPSIIDGRVCCTTVSLDPSQQFTATSPDLAYAIVTPTATDAVGNFLLDFVEESLAYQRVAGLYAFGSSSVTKAQLMITNSSEPTSVRRKRFRFLIQDLQPSTLAVSWY